jgi:D-aspartate ligase
VANVEFKRDPRDGQLKLIECNARFTAANVLLTASGIDLGTFVYRRLAGLPQPPFEDGAYAKGLRLWYPLDDFQAFLDLRRDGRLDLGSWLRDVAHRQVLPYFDWSDPTPSAMRLKAKLRALAASGTRRVSRKWARRA